LANFRGGPDGNKFTPNDELENVAGIDVHEDIPVGIWDRQAEE